MGLQKKVKGKECKKKVKKEAKSFGKSSR